METNCKVKKMNSIEAFRFVFMLIICIWHYQSTKALAHGYMAVEFFFILSGVLMFFSSNKEYALGTLDYTMKKVKRFAPDCLLLIVYVNLRHMILPALLGRKELDVSWLLQALPESLFLQNIGIYTGGVNFPMWYVSVLLFGGAFVYALLRFDKRLTVSIILPMIVLVGYTYIFSMDKRGRIDSFDLHGGIYTPMLRGVCGISLGVVLGYIFVLKKQCVLRVKTWVIDALGLISLCLFLVFAIFPTSQSYDRYLLIIVPFLLLACFVEKSLFNKLFGNKYWAILGGYSWQMLVYHGRIIIPLYVLLKTAFKFAIPLWLDLLLFSIVCVGVSAFFKMLVPKITLMVRKMVFK